MSNTEEINLKPTKNEYCTPLIGGHMYVHRVVRNIKTVKGFVKSLGYCVLCSSVTVGEIATASLIYQGLEKIFQ